MLLWVDIARLHLQQNISCIVFDSTSTRAPLFLDVSGTSDIMAMADQASRYAHAP